MARRIRISLASFLTTTCSQCHLHCYCHSLAAAARRLLWGCGSVAGVVQDALWFMLWFSIYYYVDVTAAIRGLAPSIMHHWCLPALHHHRGNPTACFTDTKSPATTSSKSNSFFGVNLKPVPLKKVPAPRYLFCRYLAGQIRVTKWPMSDQMLKGVLNLRFSNLQF